MHFSSVGSVLVLKDGQNWLFVLKCLSYHSTSDVWDIYLDPYISSFFRSVKPHSFEVIFVFDLRKLNPTVNDDFSRRFQLGELFKLT